MKILSRMLSKKIEPQEAAEFERKHDGFSLDDAGQLRKSRDASASEEQISAKEEEPEIAGSGWGQADDWDDDWDDDDDWGAEDDPSVDVAERRQTQDKQHLVSEIRDAMVSVSHVQPEDEAPQETARKTSEWADDEEFGRRARARSQLTNAADETEDRLMEQTESAMSDKATSRRRSAMAHMKAAAAATKADRVLSQVASHDASGDPAEQSPYRDDLAKVVRPHSTSRPISRQVSRPNATSPVWDQGAGDADAALYAAAEDDIQEDPAVSVENEMAAAEERRLARTASELTASDFSDDPFADDAEDFDDEDDGFSARDITRSEFPSSRFAEVEEESGDELDRNAFEDMDDEDETSFEQETFAPEPDPVPDFDDDDDGPRPSSVVAEAVAFANAPDEEIEEQPETDVRKKIWEMADEVAAEVETARESATRDAPISEPRIENLADVSSTVVAGRAGRSAGRVKTRLLGFQAEDQEPDVFAAAAEKAQKAPSSADMFPSGWIVVIDGPGRGASFTLMNGVSQIGRGEEQTVRLDFGDTSISRNNHAAVAYDDETGKFYLGHGGKSNLVRLNGMPVLSTEEMSNGDEIRIGETSLKFVALCGDAFTWSGNGDSGENA